MTKYKPLSLSLQENTDIGYVPINTQSSHEFYVDNKNDFPVQYKWKHTVFQVEPSSGVLLPKTHNKFKILFSTQEAVVLIGTIVLETEQEEPRVFKLSVIGKYSNLGCTNQPIEFGASTVGRTTSRKVVIKNSSVVPSAFKIKNSTTLNFKDNPFSIHPTHGQIPAKSSYELDIRYSPQISDIVYNGQFTVESESGNNLSLLYHAKSVAFDVSLTPKSINFGEVKLQSTTNRALTLHNNSDADTDYQFFCQVGNVFSIGEFKGTIPANSLKKVIIQFDPKNTICYYERIYCIIRNHKLLYVDLMGTCYDLLIKPLPIVQIHVDLFRRRVIEGRLSEIDFKYLQSNLQIKINRKLELLKEEKSLMSLEQFDLPEINFQESPTALHKQLFLEGTENQLLTLSTDFIDFGHCDTMTISSQQELMITNNFPCKMTIYWINQKRQNFNGGYMTAFQIYPESATIKPGASVKFNISFRPLKSQYFFFQHFQFFAIKESNKINKKTLEDYEKKQLRTLRPQVTLLRTLKVTQTIQSKVTQELETAEVMPPIHGVVRCVGNSFGIPSSAYIPIMKVFPSKNVVFPPSKVGESTYQTVQLINDSDTPTYFKVSSDVNKIFRVFPKAGLIEGKSFQILTFQFTPKTYKNYNTTLPIHLNGSNGNPMILSLIGQCPQPKLRIPQNKLFFSKCFLGVYSKQVFTIQNLSRLPVNFKAEIPQKYEEEVFLNISQKKLQSNQILSIELCFIPKFKKQYKIRIPIKIAEEERVNTIGYYKPCSGIEENSSILPVPKEEEYYIQVFGEGGDGSLVLEKEEIDFGVVKVLQQKKIQVKLTNLSDCTFYIEHSLKSNIKEASSSDIQNSFILDSNDGTLVAKGSTLIGITFAPSDVKDYDISLVISARQKYPKALKLPSKNINVAKCSLLIKAQGSYPLLQAVDIRNDALSVTALWESFELSSFNHSMSTNLTPHEKKYLNIQTLPFKQSQALQQKLVSFDWNFGYISHKNSSKPRKVLLTIKNFGGIDLDYNFKFPFDNAIQKQIWADPGEPTKEEAYEKAIIAKKIFQVRPKSGQLKSGELKDIELIYTPANISNNKTLNEEHFLKTVLEIKNGKAMVINLRGTTLGPQQGLLVVKKKSYTLPNTPIGMITALRFPIQLQNVGSAKISYDSKIQYQSGQFQEVFGITNPSGVLANLQKDFIYCEFKPLQIKQYTFKVFLNVYNSDKVQTQKLQIELKGSGIDSKVVIPKVLKLSKQIPSQRALVSDIGSKVFFSIQEIDFSVVKPLESTYKMIIIYNLSPTSSLNFDFPEQNIVDGKNSFTCGDKFVIEPNNGEIQPNEFVELKITLTADSNPSCYEGQIQCNVVWNNKDLQDPNQVNEKETLFLRVKKQAEMPFTNNSIPPTFSADSTIFQNIFSNIIKSSLTNSDLIQSFKQIQDLPTGIIDFLFEDPPVSIQNVNDDMQGVQQPKNQIDNTNYRAMFVNPQFLNIGQIILENTFFNIIQETTHGQNDLLRVTKKFITNNNNSKKNQSAIQDDA